jgi:hypothetical protein
MPPDVCEEIKNLLPPKLNFVQAVEDVSDEGVLEISFSLIMTADIQMESAYPHPQSPAR